MLATVASALFIFLALMAAYSLRNGRVEPRFFLFPPVESLGAGLMLAGLFSAAVIACFYATVYFTDAILARLRRINQRLVESNRQLAALDLAKSRFLRLSSHQLRSPVAAIHSMMSAMQEVGGFNPQQYQIIQKIQARIQDVMAQVDEMMLLSTIKESAAETTQLAPVDVDATLAAVGEAFREEAVNKGLALAVDGSSRAIVSAWEDALETVLEHLISNAVKYTPSGGAVTATAARKGGQVEILVADSGIGIPADQQDRLFHEFFRATNARQVAGGTGMGLAIVKAIVERLGGMIEICSTQDRGTTVRVGLPVTAEAPSAAEAPAAEKSIHRELQTVFL
ncbi:MAG: sensor histidine kinase [Phycisphaerae bacterium]